ncbi:MAG TPA: hypothetical protein VGI93_07630 [Steroidobacteraceae bacterium]|jgi:hypothetical protein
MSAPQTRCRECRHFNASPEVLESALKGLSSLSSAYATVRSDDGLCALHERYLSADSRCAHFEANSQA